MRRMIRRIYYMLNRARLQRELEDEMSVHREMMPNERRDAFGSALQLREQSRDVWGWIWFDHFCQDLIFAVRTFTRRPRFAVSALAAIALAVGAATAVFSVADRSLFRPLPYQHGDRLISVGLQMPLLGPGEIMFAAAYRDWRASQEALDLTSWRGVGECDLAGVSPQRLSCARAEATFLSTLGVEPLFGRNFTADEDVPGAAPVALVSYRFWRANFGEDAGAVGQTITLDGTPTKIVGILPPTFETPDLTEADLLVPQKLPPGRNHELMVIGRLRAGHNAASAKSALTGPFERFRDDFAVRVGSRFRDTMWLYVEPLRERQTRQYRRALWLLLAGVAAFVMIACANVANLLLARSAARRQEFAIRAALGCSRRRVSGQLLTESALLGLVGGAVGCGLAWVLLRIFVSLAPDGTLRLREATVDARVLLFAVALSLGTALVFGLAPSLHCLRVELLSGERVSANQRRWVRQALIATQFAVSVVLLAAAGLLLMSFWRMQHTPLGFDRERVVTASFTLPTYRYVEDARQVNFFNRLEARLNELPGSVAAAITDSLPPGPAVRTAPYASLASPGERITDPSMSGSIKWRYVSAGYFEALGIPIRRGRSFSHADREPGVRNVVVSESLARRLAGGGDPIGRRMGGHTVIGVAGDVRNAGLDRLAGPEFYQVRKATREGITGSGDPAWWRRATVIVRSSLSEKHAAESVRAAFQDVDSAVPLELETMERKVGAFLNRPRFHTTLLAMFAFTGLALAAIGLYGLVSFVAAERTREIGVRVALGATPRAVAGVVMSDGLRSTVVGVVAGLAGAGAVLRLLEGLLYEVKITDIRAFAGALCLLACVALAAAWLPARRASRIDPMAALRHE